MAILLTAMASWGQTLNIGGHRAPLDTLNNTWLCSIPQSQFGSDFEAVVSFDESIVSLFIEDSELQSGDSYVFTGIEGGKQYPVVAMMGGDSIMIGNITFTWLPVVELTGTFGNDYTRGYVTVSEPDSAFAEPMFAKVKWRGGATNVDGSHKRNYHIKFLNEEDTTKQNHRFFGLRNDNSWILDAGQVDFLRIRNRINSDLWLDMARKPWYADSIANVRNGSRGHMVEVLLNGAYVGIYNMCEPIDRKQLKIQRYDVDDKNRVTIHGVLWKADSWTTTVNMSNPKVSTGVTSWDGFQIKYPDYSEIFAYHWRSLYNAVWFANRADTNFALRDSMSYYFDLP
ncbi:MAG: CotH kinase family protein, partial [Muribaculaceae bacterium]|nr:CotH kinase family protein [Muribaculaceae bacterium]